MEQTENRAGKRGVAARCAMAGAAGLAVTCVLLLAPAILVSHGTISSALSDHLILVCVIAGGTVSGAVIRAGGAGGAVPMGALGGACMSALIALAAASRGAEAGFDVFSLKLLICGVTGGVFGGVLKNGSRGKKRRKHKK